MLDISYIMNKLTEIDVLKVLLFDKTQRELFEYIPKPEISLENSDQKNESRSLHKEISRSYGKRNSEKARLAWEAFYKIWQKKEKTHLDEKLLQLVPKFNKKKDGNENSKMFMVNKLNFFEKNKKNENHHELQKMNQNFFTDDRCPRTYSKEIK